MIPPSETEDSATWVECVLWSDGSVDARGVGHFPDGVASLPSARVVWIDGTDRPRADDGLRRKTLARLLRLDEQEAAMVELVFLGLKNDHIAGELGLPVGTVKSRLARLCRDLGVRNRVGAAVLASQVLGSASPEMPLLGGDLGRGQEAGQSGGEA